MVECYMSSGHNLSEAKRLYASPEHLQSLRSLGILNPKIPDVRTILAAYQRLLETGSLSIQSSMQGRGHPPLPVRNEESVLRYFEEHPHRSTRQAS